MDIMNPGGTGMNRLVISERFAPLLPRMFFIAALPSDLPFPKKYMYFMMYRL